MLNKMVYLNSKKRVPLSGWIYLASYHSQVHEHRWFSKGEKRERGARVAFPRILHTLNLRKSQRKQIYAVTPRSRKKKYARTGFARGFKFFRDMLAAAPRETEMSGTREAGWELMRFPGTRW